MKTAECLVVCVVILTGVWETPLSARQAKQKTQAGAVQGGPTQVSDQVPKFNMDYFVGEWQFEWIAPDSPLGEGGPITGTESVKKVWDGRFYEIAIKGEGRDGPFTGVGIMSYLDTPAGQYVTKYEVTHGLALLKAGVLGGDLGGNYNHFWETPPFQLNGKTIKLEGRSSFTSPAAYRVIMRISIDGAASASLGTMYYTRQPSSKRPASGAQY